MSLANEVPPVVDWNVFYPNFSVKWDQGQHCLFSGPTGLGKTLLCRTLVRRRQFVVVLGTKMADSEMEAYLEEGYKRIYDWPPMGKNAKPDEYGRVRLVLWPKIRNRVELRSCGPMFQRCLDQLLVDGGWTVVADESLWLSERKGLNCGDQLAAVAYTGRAMGVTLCALMQRPSGLPRNIWANAGHAFIFHSGVSTDLQELTSLSVYPPADTKKAIHALRGHQFLYLPTRAGADWAITQVAL